MKYKIEKNTVQETLILPLYSRKLCTELYPNLYRDETAVRLLDQIDYDFSQAEKNSRSLMQRFGALEVAMRQNDLAFEVRAYLKNHPCAAVVNLGCGLDNTGRVCDNGRCKIYNLDFPDVIALRQQLLPAGSEATQIRTIALWGIFGGDFIESDGFCAVFVVECNQNFFIIKINGVHERVDKRFPVAFYVRVEFAEPGQPEPNLIFA